MSALHELWHRLQRRLPPTDVVFAYGSGVFRQATGRAGATGGDEQKKMIDLVFGVRDVRSWHTRNLRLNSAHYSSLAQFGGARAVEYVTRNGAPRIWYNTLVPFDGQLIKYGVIGLQDLAADCNEWNECYVAGRLHKPVAVLHDATAAPAAAAASSSATGAGAAATAAPAGVVFERTRATNLQHALRTALLTIPARFTEHALYTRIASLSYTGDVRMGVAEDPHKVRAIVTPQLHAFRELYAPALTALGEPVVRRTGPALDGDDAGASTWEHDTHSAHVRAAHFQALPRAVQTAVVSQAVAQGLLPDAKRSADFVSSPADDSALMALVAARVAHGGAEEHERLRAQQRLVLDAVGSVVNASSTGQLWKGAVSAGVGKSVRYALRKVTKFVSGSTPATAATDSPTPL